MVIAFVTQLGTSNAHPNASDNRANLSVSLIQKADSPCQALTLGVELNTIRASASLTKRLKSLVNCFVHSSDTIIEVTGHYGQMKKGDQDYALSTSSQMAKAVQSALVSLGVPQHRIVTSAYGYDRPLCTDTTVDCAKKNHRVDVRVRPRR